MTNQAFKQLSRYEQLERTTKNNLLDEWSSQLCDVINEVIEYDMEGYNSTDLKDVDFDNLEEIVGERLWESIDGDADVIYTANAKLICDILDIDIFGECDMTGEKFSSWSHAAFSGIHTMIYNELDIMAFLNKAVSDHFSKFLLETIKLADNSENK